MTEFLYKVGDAEIAYCLDRVNGLEHIPCMLPETEIIKTLYDTGIVKAAAAAFTYPVMVYRNNLVKTGP